MNKHYLDLPTISHHTFNNPFMFAFVTTLTQLSCQIKKERNEKGGKPVSFASEMQSFIHATDV